jgi:hypothetical protein
MSIFFISGRMAMLLLLLLLLLLLYFRTNVESEWSTRVMGSSKSSQAK